MYVSVCVWMHDREKYGTMACMSGVCDCECVCFKRTVVCLMGVSVRVCVCVCE